MSGGGFFHATAIRILYIAFVREGFMYIHHCVPIRLGHLLFVFLLVCGSLGFEPASAMGRQEGTVRHLTTPRCPRSITPRGSATFSDWQFPDTLNPYQYTRLASRQVINALLDNLFVYDDRARVVPQMAASVPTAANGGIRDGGRTIMLQLKRGLRWSNGTAITARDVQFGWRVGMDKATGPACLGSCDAIQRIDIRSAYTAVLRLRAPDSTAIPSAMPDVWPHRWPNAWADDTHAAAIKLGEDQTFNFEDATFPTDGPYQVANVKHGQSIRFRPMRYYTGMSCGAPLRSLTFSAYSSKGDLIQSAADGKTDVALGFGTPDLPEISKHKGLLHAVTRTSFAFEHLEFNVDGQYAGHANPLADTRVRQALALALDRSLLVRTALVLNQASARGLVAWSPFVNAPDLKQPFVDTRLTGQWDPISHGFVQPGTPGALRDARRLLARTPFGKGFTIALFTTSGSIQRQAQEAVIATGWEKLGVKVAPNYVSSGKLLGSWKDGGVLSHGAFQVAMFAYIGSPDPGQYRFNLQARYCDRKARVHSTLNGNGSCVHDYLIDHSFNVAGSSFDTRTRARGYATVQQRVNQEAYWIPLYFRPTVITVDKRLHNVSINPTQLGPTWNIYAWKVGKS